MWQEQVSFEVVDQYLLDIEVSAFPCPAPPCCSCLLNLVHTQVFNQSVTGKDVLLGFSQLSLLSIYRTGR